MIMWLLYDLWCIVYKKKRFICVFCYEWRTANDYLFKIATQLQTNQRLISDFWQLFYSDNIEKKSQKKSVNEFITENNVKLKAFSMGMSMRWQVFMSDDWLIRPDSVVFDDIDVLDSVRNKEIIDKNFRFLEDEVFGWLADYCQVRVLWNVIRDDWLNPRIKAKYLWNHKWSIQSQAIYNEDWNIAWERYVETDIEAEEYNRLISDAKKQKISLESKRRDLWEISYNQNYLLKAFKEWDKLIKDEYIRLYEEDIPFDYIEVGIDPAFSEKTKSDAFSITITGFKQLNSTLYKFVEEEISLIWQQKNNENICKTVLNVYLQYKPRNIKIEKNNWWEIFAKMFMDNKLMWWYNLPITSMSAVKDKWTRLKEFEWCFQRWEISFRVSKTKKLVEELKSFTGENWNKDDSVDSMVYSFIESWSWFYFDTV